MTKLLTSSWMTLPVSAIIYLTATLAFWKTPVPPKHQETPGLHGQLGASWEFKNPEADQLLAELREEKKAVDKKQQQLTELEQHLNAERAEITQAAQSVNRLQKEFYQNVLRVREEETANLKKLAKVYSAMTAEGAAGIFAGMEDLQVAKIMVFMKETETAGILEVMGKKGGAEAKRAAALSERLRLASFRSNSTPAK
jgi:flagellar motility protein MotE (MotC chaperone)